MPTIDQLAETTALGATDVIPVMQGGATRKAQVQRVKAGLALTKADVGLANVSDLPAGVANGYATLGDDGKLASSQLPPGLGGGLQYQGVWNASTNTPTIPSASSANTGYYFKVSVAGSTNINGITSWAVGDWIISNGTTWDKITNAESVSSVAGKTGAVSLTKADVGLSNVDNIADANKQVSGPQAAAIALKQDILQVETSLASASTVNIDATASENLLITGTTGITSFANGTAGRRRKLRFAASLVITHNVAAGGIDCIGKANITTQAGDACELISTGAGWRMTMYSRADGKALVGSAGAGGLVSAAQIASPTSQMLADQTAVYVLNEYPYYRYRSNGFALVRIEDSADDSPAFSKLTGRIEVKFALAGYRFASQGSGVISAAPTEFEGVFIEAVNGTVTSITVYDNTAASGRVLLTQSSPAASTWYGLPDSIQAVNGLYLAVAGGGTVTVTFKKGA
jgi:hypothetical protein